MSEAPPSVDVYIVHWSAPRWCAEAVESVRKSAGVVIRCHVVDNGASGGEALRAMLPADVDVITTPENVGYAGAANVACAHALATADRADFVAVAAHDVRVEPDTFAALVATFALDGRIGIVGPVLTAPATEAGGAWRGWRAKAFSTWDDASPFVDRDWVSGTLLTARSDCVASVGGFDERLGSYVEDVELCLRARDGGWRVGIATRARARGVGSISTDVTLLVDVNSALVAAKRRGVRAVPPILVRYLAWSARGVVAAALPGRTRDRRAASLRHARDHLRAAWRLGRQWDRVRDMARSPAGGVARFTSR